eukprot:4158610-Amphidinium_carterae.1
MSTPARCLSTRAKRAEPSIRESPRPSKEKKGQNFREPAQKIGTCLTEVVENEKELSLKGC